MTGRSTIGNHGEDRRATPVRWLGALALLLLWSMPAGATSTLFLQTINSSAPCYATGPSCLNAGMFGLLVGWDVPGTGYTHGTLVETGGTGNHSTDITGTGNGGDVGIGTGSIINTSGGGTQTWTGPIDFADTGTATTHTSPVYNVPSTSDVLTNVTVTGGTQMNVASVDSALNQILSISSYYAGQTGTSLGAFGGSNTTIGVIGAGIQIFTATSINVNKVITIQGGANDLIIINDSSSAIFRGGGKIFLSGISPDQVLFNLTGSGTVLSISGNDAIAGDFIVRGSYNVSAATLSGRILGGTGTLTLGANFVLIDPEDVTTPEPSEWVLMTGGLSALLFFGRKLPGRSGLKLSGRICERIQADAEGPVAVCQPDEVAAAESGGSTGPPLPEAGIPPPREDLERARLN
jgi:hypothetical protein